MTNTVATFPLPRPFNPDLTERLAERSEDQDKDGFNNLGPGHDQYEYNGTTIHDPFQQKTYTLQFAQKVNGGAGYDTIYTSSGNDTVYGGSGYDVISSGDGEDSLYGGSTGDWLQGGFGDDKLSGGSGNDVLGGDEPWGNGDGGNDRLDGGSGNDRLFGFGGADVLIGGTGADTFFFYFRTDSTVWRPDQIRDFDHAEGDKIDLPHFLVSPDKLITFANGPSVEAGTVWTTRIDAKHDFVYVNIDGGAADMAISVTLAPGSPHLMAADFVFS